MLNFGVPISLNMNITSKPELQIKLQIKICSWSFQLPSLAANEASVFSRDLSRLVTQSDIYLSQVDFANIQIFGQLQVTKQSTKIQNNRCSFFVHQAPELSE